MDQNYSKKEIRDNKVNEFTYEVALKIVSDSFKTNNATIPQTQNIPNSQPTQHVVTGKISDDNMNDFEETMFNTMVTLVAQNDKIQFGEYVSKTHKTSNPIISPQTQAFPVQQNTQSAPIILPPQINKTTVVSPDNSLVEKLNALQAEIASIKNEQQITINKSKEDLTKTLQELEAIKLTLSASKNSSDNVHSTSFEHKELSSMISNIRNQIEELKNRQSYVQTPMMMTNYEAKPHNPLEERIEKLERKIKASNKQQNNKHQKPQNHNNSKHKHVNLNNMSVEDIKRELNKTNSLISSFEKSQSEIAKLINKYK